MKPGLSLVSKSENQSSAIQRLLLFQNRLREEELDSPLRKLHRRRGAANDILPQ
jgi:hypothetical protein